MNDKAFEAAKERLHVARGKVAAMTTASDIKILAQLWEEFLTVQQQVFLRLKKAFERGPSKLWSDTIDHERRTDDMLRYVEQARHANEHGINNITEKHNSMVAIKPRDGSTSLSVDYMEIDNTGPITKIVMDPATAAKISIDFTPGSVKLIAVRNRGVNYDPPSSHLGYPIICSPIPIAELTIEYLAKKINEAEVMFRH